MTLRPFSGGVGRLRLGLLLILMVLAATGGAGRAKADSPTVLLSPGSGPPGSQVVVDITYWSFGWPVSDYEFEVSWDGTLIAAGATDNSGHLGLVFTVPSGATVGPHFVDVWKVDSPFEATFTFTVTAPPLPPSPTVTPSPTPRPPSPTPTTTPIQPPTQTATPTPPPTQAPKNDVIKVKLPLELGDATDEETICKAVSEQMKGKGTSAKNAVLVTHGWNGFDVVIEGGLLNRRVVWKEKPETTEHSFVDPLSQAIRNRTNSAQWDIFAFHWNVLAEGRIPASARTNAETIGKCVAKELSARGYEHVHLVGHSAGARLVAKTATVLKAGSGKKPTVHATFLDAYTYLASPNEFGGAADFSEHYYVPDVAPWTQTILAGACNLEVSDVSARDHGAPIDWYRETVTGAKAYGVWGFPKSKEAAGNPTAWTGRCDPGSVGAHQWLNSQGQLKSDSRGPLAPVGMGEFTQKSNGGWFLPMDSGFRFGTGPKASLSGPSAQQLADESVVAEAEITTAARADALEFDVRFGSGSEESALVIAIDGQVVSYGFLGAAGGPAQILLPVPLQPGMHAVTFGLVGAPSTTAEATITDIHLSSSSVSGGSGTGSPDAPLPPNTGSGLTDDADGTLVLYLAAALVLVSVGAGWSAISLGRR